MMLRRLLVPVAAATVALVTVLGGATTTSKATSLPPPAVSIGEAASRGSASRVLHLSGDLRTHDPALTRDGAHGDWYVFSTGDPNVGHGTVQIRRSSGLRHWRYVGTVFGDIPGWVRAAVPGV